MKLYKRIFDDPAVMFYLRSRCDMTTRDLFVMQRMLLTPKDPEDEGEGHRNGGRYYERRVRAVACLFPDAASFESGDKAFKAALRKLKRLKLIEQRGRAGPGRTAEYVWNLGVMDYICNQAHELEKEATRPGFAGRDRPGWMWSRGASSNPGRGSLSARPVKEK